MLVRHLICLQVPLDPHVCQLLEPAKALPPVLPSFVLANTVEELGSEVTHILVPVEKAEGDVEESRMGFGCHA